MGVGWRRAFCTSMRGDPDYPVIIESATGEKQQSSPSPTPRSCAKLGFFSNAGSRRCSSNPSTPRLQGTYAASLRCRTKSVSLDSPQTQMDEVATPTSSTTTTPTTTTASSKNTPRKSPIPLIQRPAFSTPSSPRSPSGFFLFRHFSRSRCRICSRSLKSSQDTPVFTAECSHAFHFPCIAAHVQSHGSLACPVCSIAWQQAPFRSSSLHRRPLPEHDSVVELRLAGGTENRNPNRRANNRITSKSREQESGGNRPAHAAGPKIYDDDEKLLQVSPAGGQGVGGCIRFNPIPEVAEEDNDEDEQGDDGCEQEDEVLGFLSASSRSAHDRPRPTSKAKLAGKVLVSVAPPVARVSAGRRHLNYVVTIKVKAPSLRSASDPVGRAPIDLVTVLDVGQGMTGEKLHMLKRSMRLVISSLGPSDRLSMVAFSDAAGAKRLLPLRRMSRQGQRAARQIVERLVVVSNDNAPSGQGSKGSFLGDALRKATKVLEDRRERNPVATIMLLSDTGQKQQLDIDDVMSKDLHHIHEPLKSPRIKSTHRLPNHLATTTVAAAATRFAHLEIPVDLSSMVALPPQQKQQEQQINHQPLQPYEDTLAKCMGGLVSVVMQDVQLHFALSTGEVSSVYLRGSRGVRSEVGGGGGSSIGLGDLYSEEEKELLVELRLPAAATVGLRDLRMVVKCSYRDPATQELVIGEDQPLLLPQLIHSSKSTAFLALRNLFVSTRAVNESRRLAGVSDYATAYKLLSSARSLIQQSSSSVQDHQHISSLDDEMAELQERRQRHRGQHEHPITPRGVRQDVAAATGRGGGGEPLTPTSAWRAAEQLAKVAIMRKSLNRVCDLHGFENAGF